MVNDLIQLNTIVDKIEKHIEELTGLGQAGFKVPLVTIPDELTAMAGRSAGPWRPLSNDLLWFNAVKVTVCAREMVKQASRIFQQLGEDESAQQAQNIIDAIDEQFHPLETALRVYDKLLNSNSRNNANGRPSSP